MNVKKQCRCLLFFSGPGELSILALEIPKTTNMGVLPVIISSTPPLMPGSKEVKGLV